MIGRMVRAWNSWWFRPAPLADLAIFRMLAAGGQLLVYAVIRRPLETTFLEVAEIPHLYEPLALVRFLMRPVGVEWTPTLVFISIVFWITIAALVLATIGLLTNAAMGVAAIGVAFLQAYAYSFGDFHHSEAIMAISLGILAISPCGRVLSVDRWRRSARNPGWREPGTFDQVSRYAAWPVLLLTCLFSLIYLSAAYYKFKSGGHGWFNGYTLQYYLLQDGLRWEKPLGVWLAGQHGIALVSSAVCVLFEALFFLVVIRPRLLWLFWPVGFGMHVGILVLMSAGFWEFLILYFALLPWSKALQWGRARRASPMVPSY